MQTIKDLKVNLESKIWESEKVIVVPHNSVDFDAIGSAVGIAYISKKLKKKPYIVYDPTYTIDGGVQLVMDEARDKYNIIELGKYYSIMDTNDLYVLTDVNKTNLISLNECMHDFNKVVIVDHHATDRYTVKAGYKYVNPKVSSASEIVTKLINEFGYKIPSDVANFLLAGIYLDTKNLTKNTNSSVFETVANLSRSGADMNVINEYFSEDFMSDRRVQTLVNNLIISSYNIAVMVDSDVEYTREELAKAADYALKYKVDVSFAIGKIDDGSIYVSARSKDKINVGGIMQKFGGGGNVYSAAARIQNSDINTVSKKLSKVLTYSIN